MARGGRTGKHATQHSVMRSLLLLFVAPCAASAAKLCIQLPATTARGLRPTGGAGQRAAAAPQLSLCLDPSSSSPTLLTSSSGWTAQTALEGCTLVVGSVTAAKAGAGGTALHIASKVSCGPSDYYNSTMAAVASVAESVAVETSADGPYFRWNISVTSASQAYWSTAITSTFSHPSSAGSQCWVPGATETSDGGLAPSGSFKGTYPLGGPYSDPRLARSACADPQSKKCSGEIKEAFAPALAIPYWAHLDTGNDVAVAVGQSLALPPIFGELSIGSTTKTSRAENTFVYSRMFHRLGGGADPAVFSQVLPPAPPVTPPPGTAPACLPSHPVSSRVLPPAPPGTAPPGTAPHCSPRHSSSLHCSSLPPVSSCLLPGPGHRALCRRLAPRPGAHGPPGAGVLLPGRSLKLPPL